MIPQRHASVFNVLIDAFNGMLDAVIELIGNNELANVVFPASQFVSTLLPLDWNKPESKSPPYSLEFVKLSQTILSFKLVHMLPSTRNNTESSWA